MSTETERRRADEERVEVSLLNSSSTVASVTMLSRVMGLLRDIVIARFIGASGHADAFFVAFKVPQFLRRLFAEGAFSQAFVPVLSSYRQRQISEGNRAAVQALINAVCGVLGGSLLLLVTLVVIAAPLVAMLFAPGFVGQTEKFQLTVDMLRITFPYLLLISLTGFSGAILNSYDRFVVPAFTPVLLNLSLIGFALFVSPIISQPVYALAWAVLFAGVAQWLFHLPFLARLELLPRPVWDLQHPGVRKILRLMVPALFGVSVSQINLLLDTVLASFLPTGSVSWLYYSDRLAELPLGVFAIAIATVILPGLSRLSLAAGDSDSAQRFAETLDWALRCIVAVAVPATVALVLLAAPILFTLFQYQAMTPADVAMSVHSLRAYAVGLLAFMAIKILASGYYARQDMKTPVRIGIIAMASNMVFNVIFVAILHYYYQLGHVGLALATSLSAYINAGLLLRGLRGSRSPLSTGRERLLSTRFWQLLWRVLLAVCAMIVVLQQTLPATDFWLIASAWQRVLQLSQLCLFGAAVYFASLYLLGVRWRQFRAAV